VTNSRVFGALKPTPTSSAVALVGLLPVGGWSGQPKEHKYGAVQAHDILIIEAPDTRSNLYLRDSGDFVRHEATGSARRPLRSFGSTGRRNNGACVGSVVNAQIVMEFVASNRSSFKITTGRGFPA
jgi:hypothetical protein